MKVIAGGTLYTSVSQQLGRDPLFGRAFWVAVTYFLVAKTCVLVL